MDEYTFQADDFELVGEANDIHHDANFSSQSFWQDVFGRLKRNKGSIFGLICIGFILFMAIIGPMISGYSYKEQNTKHIAMPPRIPVIENLGILDGTKNGRDVYAEKGADDVYYWFGTDSLGRDLFTRCWEGTRVSLFIAGVAVAIDIVIGMTYGLISGYFGGIVDIAMQRFIEIVSGIPTLIIVTLLMIVLQPGLTTITLALLITGWIGMSRTARAQVLKLKEQEFILASRTLGSGSFTILLKDVLPNIFGQIIIMSMFSIPNAIFTEAFLAFIGLGVPPPTASLGVLISEGNKSILTAPYMLFIPVIILAILMLSFNLLADGLRDAFDVRMKEM
ncbi:MAG: oligopeptide ABC transporter permease [Coprobacillaceae bacterium]